jgi:transcription initiation factor TFIID subunit 2
VFKSRRIFCNAISQQYFGVYQYPEKTVDRWLTNGLSNLIGLLGIRKILGENEYKYQVKSDMEVIVMNDTNQPPLYHKSHVIAEEMDSEFLQTKAYLVLYMLSRKLGKQYMIRVISI